MTYNSNSPKQTQKIAASLAKKMLSTRVPLKRGSFVIALEGELGAGKTVFVQGFAKAMGIKSKIKSPTFNLMKHYKITKSNHFKMLYHIDCYRLKDYKDLLLLGIKNILNSQDNIILIEWAERVKPILPKKHVKIHIDHVNSEARKIEIGSYNAVAYSNSRQKF